MSTPLLDRIAARSAEHGHDCLGPIIATGLDRPAAYALADDRRASGQTATVDNDGRGRYSVRAWADIPLSPFVRRALARELPGKVIR